MPRQAEKLVFRLRGRSRGLNIIKAVVLMRYNYLYDIQIPGL